MSDDGIFVESLVGYKTGQPLVQFTWGNKQAQLTAAEARLHAFRILECADAAETDLFLWRFATSTIGVNAGGAAKFIVEFREFRKELRAKFSENP